MGKSKATHKGECQICGKVQKLPQGRLANHGYTVEWGMFQGTCPGSLALPYEQSCDLLKDRLLLIEQKLKRIRQYHQNLLQPATEPCGYVEVYFSDARVYGWVEAHLTEVQETNESNGYSWREVFATYKEGSQEKKQKLNLDFETQQQLNLLEIATSLNRKYAQEYQKQLNIMSNYLKWCQNRVNKWEVKELTLLT